MAMRTLTFLSLVFAFLITGCSGSDEKKIISVKHTNFYKKTEPIQVDRELTVEVGGMSCEHACGGAIRMALKETGAVERCSFNFEADRPFNKAIITFDKAKISPDKIIAIIQKLNDKQFTTKNGSTRTIAPSTTTQNQSIPMEDDESESTVNISTPTSIQLPSLIELFARLIN